MCAQAINIHQRNGYLHEAHIHVLVNITKQSIVLLEKREDRMACVLYTPGYDSYREVIKDELRTLVAQLKPPLLMHLKANHFSALLPSAVECQVYHLCEVDD